MKDKNWIVECIIEGSGCKQDSCLRILAKTPEEAGAIFDEVVKGTPGIFRTNQCRIYEEPPIGEITWVGPGPQPESFRCDD